MGSVELCEVKFHVVLVHETKREMVVSVFVPGKDTFAVLHVRTVLCVIQNLLPVTCGLNSLPVTQVPLEQLEVLQVPRPLRYALGAGAARLV